MPQMLSHLRGDPVGEHLAATHLGGGRDTCGGAPFSPSSELGLRKELSHLRGDPEVGEQVALPQLALPPTSWRFGIIFSFARLSLDSQGRISWEFGRVGVMDDYKLSRPEGFPNQFINIFCLFVFCVNFVCGVCWCGEWVC